MAPRPRRLKRLALAVAVATAACVGGCIQNDGTRFDPVPGRTRMSVDAERELGWEFDQQVQRVLPLVTDLAVLEFMDDLGNVLVERLGEQPFDYRFRVVVSPQLNAFAVPGGYIYLHTGTILAAGDVEELAGVLAHELAHVKGRHHARLVQETALPNLLTSLAGIAAGAATGSAGPMVAAEGLNVALQLRYTRQFEDEADRVGAVFLTRAGWTPDGMVRFFERILLEKDRLPEGIIPPYLFSHPQVETRIDVVRELDERLAPVTRPPRMDARFREIQARLAWLVASRRETATMPEPFERGRTEPLLDGARRESEAGRIDAALATLLEAERVEPNDPRVPLLRGDILMAADRPADAVVAYRRAVYLDPSPPAVLLALARAHRDAGDRRRAIFFAEQAVWRAGDRGTLRQQAERELERLLFPVIPESGFGLGPARPGDAPPSRATVVSAADREVEYWVRVGPHYVGYASYFRTRWIDPRGAVVREERPDRQRRVYLTDTLELPRRHPLLGTWRLEVLLADDVVHTERFVLVD